MSIYLWYSNKIRSASVSMCKHLNLFENRLVSFHVSMTCLLLLLILQIAKSCCEMVQTLMMQNFQFLWQKSFSSHPNKLYHPLSLSLSLLFFSLSIYLTLFLLLSLSVSLSFSLFLSTSHSLSIYLSLFASTYLTLFLSIYLFLSVSLFLPISFSVTLFLSFSRVQSRIHMKVGTPTYLPTYTVFLLNLTSHV